MLGIPDLLYLSQAFNRPPGDSLPGTAAPVAAKSEHDVAPARAPRTAPGWTFGRKRVAVDHRAWRPSGW